MRDDLPVLWLFFGLDQDSLVLFASTFIILKAGFFEDFPMLVIVMGLDRCCYSLLRFKTV